MYISYYQFPEDFLQYRISNSDRWPPCAYQRSPSKVKVSVSVNLRLFLHLDKNIKISIKISIERIGNLKGNIKRKFKGNKTRNGSGTTLETAIAGFFGMWQYPRITATRFAVFRKNIFDTYFHDIWLNHSAFGNIISWFQWNFTVATLCMVSWVWCGFQTNLDQTCTKGEQRQKGRNFQIHSFWTLIFGSV